MKQVAHFVINLMTGIDLVHLNPFEYPRKKKECVAYCPAFGFSIKKNALRTVQSIVK